MFICTKFGTELGGLKTFPVHGNKLTCKISFQCDSINMRNDDIRRSSHKFSLFY